MSPEDDKYYDNYLDLFLHDGWKQFIEESAQLLDSYKIEDIKNEQDLFFTKGQVNILTNITRFETAIRNALEMESEDA